MYCSILLQGSNPKTQRDCPTLLHTVLYEKGKLKLSASMSAVLVICAASIKGTCFGVTSTRLQNNQTLCFDYKRLISEIFTPRDRIRRILSRVLLEWETVWCGRCSWTELIPQQPPMSIMASQFNVNCIKIIKITYRSFEVKVQQLFGERELAAEKEKATQ